MLSFPAAIKVYLCTVPCDMRRSFDGLSIVTDHDVFTDWVRLFAGWFLRFLSIMSSHAHLGICRGGIGYWSV
jgi:hypothetical protein